MKKVELVNILKQHRIKATPQRVAILNLLVGNTQHPTAEGLFKVIQKKEPSLSLATVYTTLQCFKKKGLLKEVNSFLSQIHYDPDMTTHAHLVCQYCQKVFDIPSATTIRLHINNEIKKKYQLTDLQLCFKGCCMVCEKKLSSKEISHANKKKKNQMFYSTKN